MADGEVPRALTADPAEVGRLLVADQWFDRKSARIEARKLAEALIGFANADGGTVVVGLHDGSVRDAGLVEWIGKSPRDPHAHWRLPR
jgi:ATP-dependent DNA helicase RecG